MADCQPPSRKHQPYEVAEEAERAGAGVLLSGIVGARHSFLTEGQQRVYRDIESGARPRNPDDGDGHDDGGKEPTGCHPRPAEQDPCDIEQQRKHRHGSPPQA
jgi:hypothetical protein